MFNVRHWLKRRDEQRGSRLLEILLRGQLSGQLGNYMPEPGNLLYRTRGLRGARRNSTPRWIFLGEHGGRDDRRPVLNIAPWRCRWNYRGSGQHLPN